MAFPELVDTLVADTKLERDQVVTWTSNEKCQQYSIGLNSLLISFSS